MDDAPPSQRGVIGYAGGGQRFVGLHDGLAVIGLDLRVVQGDLTDDALHAVHLDGVADGEGVGGQNHQSPGHVAQNVLRRQRHAQCHHRHQRRQRRGVDAQRSGGDDGRQQVQHGLDGGADDFLQPFVELLCPAQQPCDQLHHQPHHHQTDQQRQNRRQDVPYGKPAQRRIQNFGNSQIFHCGILPEKNGYMQYSRLVPVLQTPGRTSQKVYRWPS